MKITVEVDAGPRFCWRCPGQTNIHNDGPRCRMFRTRHGHRRLRQAKDAGVWSPVRCNQCLDAEVTE